MVQHEALRTAFLISGNGTTMEAAVGVSQRDPSMHINPVLVVSSRPDAQGIERAGAAHIPVEVVCQMDTLLWTLQRYHVELVVQTGWLPKTPPDVIAQYRNMIINQHPGRLPDFGGKGMYGRRVTCATIAFFRLCKEEYPWTASTVHYVTADYDAGELIQVARVNILSHGSTLQEATRETHQRLLRVEHDNVTSVLYHFGNNSVPPARQATSFVDGRTETLLRAKEIATELFPKG